MNSKFWLALIILWRESPEVAHQLELGSIEDAISGFNTGFNFYLYLVNFNLINFNSEVQ